jgi:hypothetical protein
VSRQTLLISRMVADMLSSWLQTQAEKFSDPSVRFRAIMWAAVATWTLQTGLILAAMIHGVWGAVPFLAILAAISAVIAYYCRTASKTPE